MSDPLLKRSHFKTFLIILAPLFTNFYRAVCLSVDLATDFAIDIDTMMLIRFLTVGSNSVTPLHLVSLLHREHVYVILQLHSFVVLVNFLLSLNMMLG